MWHYYIDTNYIQKALKYVFNEFLDGIKDEPDAGELDWEFETAKYRGIQLHYLTPRVTFYFTDRNNIELQATYLLEFIDFINNHELTVYLNGIRFFNREMQKKSRDGHFSVDIGSVNGVLYPLYEGEEKYINHVDNNFVERMLNKYDELDELINNQNDT